MRVLMLGGTGAMGRPLAKILASRGAEVVITSRSRSGSDKKGMEYRQGDAHDIGFLKRLLKDFYDVIIGLRRGRIFAAVGALTDFLQPVCISQLGKGICRLGVTAYRKFPEAFGELRRYGVSENR